MNALTESIWVAATYGTRPLALGTIIAAGLAIWGLRRLRRGLRIAALMSAILVLWAGIFMAVDGGYRAWQRTANPPDEAFSDTAGPFLALSLGWLPGAVILVPLHAALRRGRRAPGPPPDSAA